MGVFDRELVMALADAHRALMRPGVLLDFLIGPWIESAGKGRLKLSPPRLRWNSGPWRHGMQSRQKRGYQQSFGS
jgi:hypothetical protein